MRKYIVVEVGDRISEQNALNYLEYFLASLMDATVSATTCDKDQLEDLITDFKKRHNVIEISKKKINFMSRVLIAHEITFT